jgi:hypothetical protein
MFCDQEEDSFWTMMMVQADLTSLPAVETCGVQVAAGHGAEVGMLSAMGMAGSPMRKDSSRGRKTTKLDLLHHQGNKTGVVSLQAQQQSMTLAHQDNFYLLEKLQQVSFWPRAKIKVIRDHSRVQSPYWSAMRDQEFNLLENMPGFILSHRTKSSPEA